MKRLIFALFFIGCSQTTQLNSENIEWCFIDFRDSVFFQEYIEAHKGYAERGNPKSMKLLGCAYYQKGDLKEAQEWLIQSYELGEEDASVALSAIYLKEGDMNQSLFWGGQILDETPYVRWIHILRYLESYQLSERTSDLENALGALRNKINQEGETEMTLGLIDAIDSVIIEAEECRDSDCVVINFEEKKRYLQVFSRGALSLLIPSNPLSWNYEPDELLDTSQEVTSSDE